MLLLIIIRKKLLFSMSNEQPGDTFNSTKLINELNTVLRTAKDSCLAEADWPMSWCVVMDVCLQC